jgi:hypothetical protein
MQLSFVMDLRVKVGKPIEIGAVATGRRRIIAIEGGTFDGPDVRGVVLAGSADWQIIRADGVTELEARYTLQTDVGELIYVQNTGLRHGPADVMQKLLAGEAVDPALVYFRTVPVFETSAPRLQWLARTVFVASGERHPNDVVIHVWKVE